MSGPAEKVTPSQPSHQDPNDDPLLLESLRSTLVEIDIRRKELQRPRGVGVGLAMVPTLLRGGATLVRMRRLAKHGRCPDGKPGPQRDERAVTRRDFAGLCLKLAGVFARVESVPLL